MNPKRNLLSQCNLLFLFLLTMLLGTACTQRFPDVENKPEDVTTIDESPVKIGTVADTTANLTLGMAKLKQGFETELGEGALIEHVYIDQAATTGKYYLVAVGSQDGKFKTIRAELNKDPNNNLMLTQGAVAEICTAVYCDECDFTPEEGCGCKGITGKKRNGCLSSVTKGAYMHLRFK